MMYKVKDTIKDFQPYTANELDYKVKLDANESSRNMTLLDRKVDLTTLNLYPDNRSTCLQKIIASYQSVSPNEVLIGAGSSELLELVVKTFVNPKDIVCSIEPSFVMYKKYTMIYGGIYQSIPARNNYVTDVNDLIEGIKTYQPKIVFLCTPNNPTGFMLSKEKVEQVLQCTNAIVVVDEAYMEYASSNETVIGLINDYTNLIVNRTFSKAFGIAGARLGYFISNKKLIDTLWIAKTPYSVNSISQELGKFVLEDLSYLEANIKNNTVEKEKLERFFEEVNLPVFKTNGNFFYLSFDAFDLYEKLAEKKVLIRSFKNGYYRITIGQEKENMILMNAIKEVLYENCKTK